MADLFTGPPAPNDLSGSGLISFWDPQHEGYESIDKNITEWDQVIFSGVVCPGIAQIKTSWKVKKDKKDGAGQAGGTTTFIGKEISEVDITIRIWTPTQWYNFQKNIMPILWPNGPSNPPGTLQITHPALTFIGVQAFTPVQIDEPSTGSTHGEKVIKIKAVQFVPPINKPAKTPRGAIASFQTPELQGPPPGAIPGGNNQNYTPGNAPRPKPSQTNSGPG